MKNKNCLTCKYFTSFREDYCDDLEPDTQGFCHCGKSPYYFNEGAGIGKCCEYYKSIKKEKEIDINEMPCNNVQLNYVHHCASSPSGTSEFWENVHKLPNQLGNDW